MGKNIFVTKPFLPPKEEFLRHIDDIYQNNILTNQGPKVRALESKLSSFLHVHNLHYVTNGTIALQLALRALDITSGDVITTPFSYVATVSSILWERCRPVFVDIEPDNFTIDPKKIENSITDKTKAIMPVHVFGYACDVGAIKKIANKYRLKVIYDAAHSFASEYNGQALCSYGDAATLSFHATKIFHTIEGGACIVQDPQVSSRLELMKRFGHNFDQYACVGINGKQGELNAAMGLANLAHLKEILAERKRLVEIYDALLGNAFGRPKPKKGLTYNYSYYPIVFESEQALLEAFERLAARGIYPRRYFYPSLNKLPYIECDDVCPIAEDIARRIACLPLFVGLPIAAVKNICQVLLCKGK